MAAKALCRYDNHEQGETNSNVSTLVIKQAKPI